MCRAGDCGGCGWGGVTVPRGVPPTTSTVAFSCILTREARRGRPCGARSDGDGGVAVAVVRTDAGVVVMVFGRCNSLPGGGCGDLIVDIVSGASGFPPGVRGRTRR